MAAKFSIKEINSQEQFQEIVENENRNGAPGPAPGGMGGTISSGRLMIVDLYHTWYGPCEAIQPTFKTLAMNTDFFDSRALFTQMELSVVPEFHDKYAPAKEGAEGEAPPPEAPKPTSMAALGAKAPAAPVATPQPLSKPKFLFYKDGKLVSEVLGINAPDIIRAINEHMPEYTPDEEA